MHISALCLPILSGAYRGCMQTPNQPSFSFSSFCLSHNRPFDAPVLHHYSALQNMEGKKENRDTHTHTHTHIFASWKNIYKNIFCTGVSALPSASFVKRTQLLLTSTGGKKFAESESLKRHGMDQLLFNMHKSNESGGECVSLTRRIFPHSLKSLTNITTVHRALFPSRANWKKKKEKGLFTFRAAQVSNNKRAPCTEGGAWPRCMNVFTACKHLCLQPSSVLTTWTYREMHSRDEGGGERDQTQSLNWLKRLSLSL